MPIPNSSGYFSTDLTISLFIMHQVIKHNWIKSYYLIVDQNIFNHF